VWLVQRHSDKAKFHSDLNRPKSCEMSERLLKTLRESGDFQAEYEGSIPFIRSNDFNNLSCEAHLVSTSRLISLRQAFHFSSACLARRFRRIGWRRHRRPSLSRMAPLPGHFGPMRIAAGKAAGSCPAPCSAACMATM